MIDLPVSISGKKGAKKIFFIHGLLANRSNFISAAADFQEDFEIIIPDMRNHGNAPHDPNHSYDDLADDLYTLFEKYKEPAAVIAHSMGGKALMNFLLKYGNPYRDCVYIIEDIFPTAVTRGNSGEIIKIINNLNLEQLKSRKEAEEILGDKIRNKTMISFVLKNLVSHGEGFKWKINMEGLCSNMGLIESFPEYPDGTSFNEPVHFIYGKNSEYHYPQVEAETLKLFPSAKFYGVKDAGHWVHFENRKDFCDIVRGLISEKI